MAIGWDDGRIRLDGACGVEEAETLLQLLIAHPGAIVDWTGCERLHSAVLQVMLAARPPVTGRPHDPFLSERIARLLAQEVAE